MSQKTVLIVEDEEVLTDLLVHVLEEQGFKTMTALNGKAGISCLKKTLPDLIITDMMMPVLNGLALCRELRAAPEYCTIPLILVSAISDQVAADCAWSAVVRKPFDIDLLLDTVKQLVGSS